MDAPRGRDGRCTTAPARCALAGGGKLAPMRSTGGAAAALAAVLAAMLAPACAPSWGAPAGLSAAAAVVSAETASPPTAAPGRLAYVTSSEAHPFPVVWSSLADGSGAQQLGPGSGPLLSPNGALVAASLFGAEGDTEHGPALAVYATAGAPARQLGNLASASALPLAWSPDSRYLAVALQSTAVRATAARSSLAVLDTQTGGLAKVATGIVEGASFAPDGSDRLVFALARSQRVEAAVNLYIGAPGAAPRRITRDGRSLNPVWGPRFIAYDLERLRRNFAPLYQVWLRRPGGGAPRRLTSIRVRSLVSGLVPLGFSSDGTRLLTEFVGQDTSEAWTVEVPSGKARAVRVKGLPVVGGGISADGSRLLVYEGGIEGPASGDNVVSLPFSGGAPTLLVAHAAQPSWNE